MEEIEKWPSEVIQTWCYMQLQYVGSETWQFIEKTIEKYPEYFPWEHKYNSIPKEVHENYRKDIGDLHNEIYPRKESDIREGEGIFAYLKRTTKVYSFSGPVDFEAIYKSIRQEQKRLDQYEKGERKLWRKHYGKFNLTFRK